MAHEILDHTRDLSGTETHRLISIYKPPAFVKEAAHDRLHGDPTHMLPHLYADPQQRLYPSHTAAATWMSALFFQDKQSAFDEDRRRGIWSRLEKTASYFGILGEITQLREQMEKDAGNELARLPDADFALVWVADGSKTRNYPLRNRYEVKTASEWFGKYRDQFTFGDRMQIAQKILGKADALGASVEDRPMLAKTAGYGHCAAADIASMCEKRANLVARSYPNHATEMRELAKVVREHPPEARDYGHRCKLASLVDQFDRDTKLQRFYTDGLERAEDVLFQVTEKTAGDFLQNHVTTTTGTIYEKQALEDLSLAQVREWMGDELADEVSIGGVNVDTEKLADVVVTLPRGDAQMFDQMADALKIPVFARDKAASSSGFSQEELEVLAREYTASAAATVATL